jgi:hypothetical protein
MILAEIEQDGLVGFLEFFPGQDGAMFGYDSYNVHIWTEQALYNSRELWAGPERKYPRYPLIVKSFGNAKMAEDLLLEKMAYSSFLLLSMT